MTEQTLTPDENEILEGEGMFRREFTLEVTDTRWARDGVRHRAPTLETADREISVDLSISGHPDHR